MNNPSPIIKNVFACALILSTGIVSTLPVFAQTAPAPLKIPYSYNFESNLSEGINKQPDVPYLKRFLDQDVRTRMASSSPCVNEAALSDYSTYFDSSTKTALMKFQELYRSEVLTPAGSSAATGIFGQYTRNKVNQLLSNTSYYPLKTPLSATVVPTTPVISSTLNSLGIVPSYLSQVNQVISNASTFVGPLQFPNGVPTTIGPKPTMVSVTPTFVTDCMQSIILTGTNLATSSNVLFGSLGTTTVDRVRTTSPTTGLPVEMLVFNLQQFSKYYAYRAVYAGTTQSLGIRLQSNGTTSDQIAVVEYTFPGLKETLPVGAPTPSTTGNIPVEVPAAEIPSIIPPAATNSQNNNTQTSSATGGQTGILKTMETTEKKIFASTPQGKILKLVGGDEAVDFAYNMSPTGHLNQKLQGNSMGAVSLTGGGNSGNSNSSSNSNSGALAALGIGAGVGLSMMGGAGGGAAAGGAKTGVAIGNFGGILAVNYTCTCSSNMMLTIQDVRGMTVQLIYQPGASILYSHYNLSTGVNVLGDYIAGGQCLIYVVTGCTTAGAPIGTIRQIGTSLTAKTK